MDIKNIYFKLIINLLILSLLIISLTGDGYIYGAPVIRIMAYIVIPFCFVNGVIIIKKSIKDKINIDYKSMLIGISNLIVSIYLFIYAAKNILFI